MVIPMSTSCFRRIISEAEIVRRLRRQSGADRAALDLALERGIPNGGRQPLHLARDGGPAAPTQTLRRFILDHGIKVQEHPDLEPFWKHIGESRNDRSQCRTATRCPGNPNSMIDALGK